MTASGGTEVWRAPQLTARLAALKGLAPPPSCFVIWRETVGADGRETSGYELPDTPGRQDEAAFEQWLIARDLALAERLTVSVLVIREFVDEAGYIHEGVIERRRGGAEGPYFGKIARVEFTGPARAVKRYAAGRDGQLTEVSPEPGDGEPPAGDLDLESFAGDDAAVLNHLGSGAIIVDRRAPSLFEDMAGLSAIIHARRPDGTVAGCGVGWHGPIAFVLEGAFPRHGQALPAPPDLDAAVAEAIPAEQLIRYETRRDEYGFHVIARKRGTRDLVLIRVENGAARIAPYTPGRIEDVEADQHRWMAYAETYEARTILDSWRDGDNGEICVLTADPDHEIWRHVIDADGIELSRVSGNETAVAALHRGGVDLATEAAASLAEKPAPAAVKPLDKAPPPPAAGGDIGETGFPAPADSLLTKMRAYAHVTDLWRAAGAACVTDGEAVPRAALDLLRAVTEPLTALDARFTAASLRKLLALAETGAITADVFATTLGGMTARLSDELAMTRVVLLPAVRGEPSGEPPFGYEVEVWFPDAMHDIEEAVRCLTLRRATAAVLHAANVARHGLRAMEDLLPGVKLADLAWPRMIGAASGLSCTAPGVLDALKALRRAWRGQGLWPATKYTEEEAEGILEGVEALMRALAVALTERDTAARG